jgi:transcriptional regulator with XRE-family HTH domain
LLSDRLLELRRISKLTQVELSSKLKIARTTYSGYELGTSEPDNETLERIADFYDVTVDNLLGRESKEETEETKKTNFIIDGLVKKYDIDLSIEGERDKLEQLIKLYADLRKP